MYISPRSKPRNPEATKAKIVAAAQDAFARRGYSQTGLRDIAEAAGVVSSLLIRYYKTKAGLFEAAFLKSLDVQTVIQWPRSEFGENLMRFLLDPKTRVLIPTLLAHSIADEKALEITTRIVRDHLVQQLAEWLGPPNARSRAISILAVTGGFVLYDRHLLADEESADLRESAAYIGRVVQRLIDGSSPVPD